MPLHHHQYHHLLLLLVAATVFAAAAHQQFREAPQFYNSPDCPPNIANNNNGDDHYSTSSTVCSDHVVHVAMTLDATYLRGSMAAILSILQHSACPENMDFHFITSDASDGASLRRTLAASFPYLRFSLYPFRSSSVLGLISTSIRSALDCPLNYARNYLPHLLPLFLRRVIYLDYDLLLVGDIAKLSATPLCSSIVLAAPEYCNANFTSYFTPTFCSTPRSPSPSLTTAPATSTPGVMVIDLQRWGADGYTVKIEEWMDLHNPLSRAKSSIGFIKFGFGLFTVSPLSGESGFGSIGRSPAAAIAAVGRVLGEFGFGFFDHSLPVVFWDR